MHYRIMRLFAQVLFVLCIFFIPVFSVSAAVSGLKISEIMYDPSGSDSNREWIEVLNSSSSPIDLSGHVFLSDGPSSSKHSLVPQGASGIPAGGYAVIVQTVDGFKTDYPAYTGLIFDSSWSGLTATTGKTLLITDSSGGVLDQVTYDPTLGGTNDGNSLQLNAGGAWAAGVPTPGAAISGVADTTEDTDKHADDDSSSDTDDSHSGTGTSGGTTPANSPTAKTAAKPKEPKIVLTAPKTATAGLPAAVRYSVLDADGMQRQYGYMYVSFGDGTFRNGRMTDALDHIYDFSGTYVVVAEYRADMYAKDPAFSARAIITVAEPGVTISGVGKSGEIMLMNSGKGEEDVSGWKLNAGTQTFAFPSGTIVLPGKTLLFPESLTHISSRVMPLSLTLPSGVLVSSYGEMQKNPEPVLPKIVLSKATAAPLPEPLLVPEIPKEIPNTLASSPTPRERSLFPYMLGIIAVIIGAVVALYKSKVLSVSMAQEKTERRRSSIRKNGRNKK